MTAGIGGPAATDATAVTAEAIAAAVRGCPAVADLHAGGLVRIATYLPGRRIDGVQLADDRVLISVVAAYGVPLVLLTDQIRAAVRPLAGGRRVDIHVADLQLPGEEQVALPPGSGTSPALGA